MKTKTRVAETWSGNNVPDDLLSEILSLLTVKSLVRFRCVSKSWRSMIDDPDFTRLHLNRFNNHPRYESRLFFTQNSTHETYECVELSTRLTLGTAPDPSLEGVRSWFIRCSTDGLFMLESINKFRSTDFMLWNPSIRKTRNLPPLPDICVKASTYHLSFGIGFDPLIKDYKYVSISVAEKRVSFIAVYTLGINSWKTITNSFPEEICYHWRTKVVSFRSCLYYLTRKDLNSPLKLVTFNLSNEMFASTRGLPEVDDPVTWFGTKELAVIDSGCTLALVNYSNSKGSIWALESLRADIKSSIWTQRYTFTIRIPKFKGLRAAINFVSLEKNGEMLLGWPDMVTSYNIETHEEKLLLKKELKNGQKYIESLIMLVRL